MKKLTKSEKAFWDAWLVHGMQGNDLRSHFMVPLEILGDTLDREFDFGSKLTRVLVECDGLGGFDRKRRIERCGGHQTAAGMKEDSRKRCSAVSEGWKVLIFPSSRLETMEVIRCVEEVNLTMARCVVARKGTPDGG